MFAYQGKKAFEVRNIHPSVQYYQLLDQQLHGCEGGLKQAMCYIRQAFMIHNPKFSHMYMELAVMLLSDMEVLSDMLHQLHGVDNRYYDESNDDTPAFEIIAPCHQSAEKEEEKHHVNNDLTACVMRDMDFEKKRVLLYEKLYHTVKEDKEAQRAFSYLRKRGEEAYKILQNILTILSTHQEGKDFGLGDSHNAFDLDTGNYFDKPNPYFINPGDIEKED